MPTYTIKNDLRQDTVLIKVYHGQGYTFSIGLIDKRKNEFMLDSQGSNTFVDDTESITMVAAIIGKESVWGEVTMWRDPKKCDKAAWSMQTSDLIISGVPFAATAKRLIFHSPTSVRYLNTVSICRVSTGDSYCDASDAGAVVE